MRVQYYSAFPKRFLGGLGFDPEGKLIFTKLSKQMLIKPAQICTSNAFSIAMCLLTNNTTKNVWPIS